MRIAISSESACDLPKELIQEFNIHTIPFTVVLGEENHLDGEVDCDQIIKWVDENGILPKTSAINEFQYSEHFSKLLNDYDAIVHFSLSSELSSAYSNAVRASKEFNNVYVVDTKSLSSGIALLVLYAKKLADEGVAPEEIYKKCLGRVDFVQASFVLKRLDYLYKGGRCNALSYFGANLLGIRPQIIVKDGKMGSGNKYRGKQFPKLVSAYCQDTLNQFNTPDKSVAFLTYTTADEETIETARQYLINAGFEKIYLNRAGGTITSHCGESCLGILYINDGDKN